MELETIRNLLSHFGLWIVVSIILIFQLFERTKRISDKKDLENLRENYKNDMTNLRQDLKEVRETSREILRELLKKN